MTHLPYPAGSFSLHLISSGVSSKDIAPTCGRYGSVITITFEGFHGSPLKFGLIYPWLDLLLHASRYARGYDP